MEPIDRVEELHEFVTALEDGDADVRVLQKLALLCSTNPIPADTASPLSPRLGLPLSPSPFIPIMRTLPPVVPDMWTKERSFDRLFDGLLKFLDPTKVRLISPPQSGVFDCHNLIGCRTTGICFDCCVGNPRKPSCFPRRERRRTFLCAVQNAVLQCN